MRETSGEDDALFAAITPVLNALYRTYSKRSRQQEQREHVHTH